MTFDFDKCVLETAKGRFRGTLEEVCVEQATLQGTMAAILVPCGDEVIQVIVDEIDFDPDDVGVAVKAVRCAAIVAAEDTGIITR